MSGRTICDLKTWEEDKGNGGARKGPPVDLLCCLKREQAVNEADQKNNGLRLSRCQMITWPSATLA